MERSGGSIEEEPRPVPVQRREFGTDAGRIAVSDDFDAPLREDMLWALES